MPPLVESGGLIALPTAAECLLFFVCLNLAPTCIKRETGLFHLRASWISKHQLSY